MSNRTKRRRGEVEPGPARRKAIKRDTEDDGVPTLSEGLLRIEINLRSQSKAKKNDPKSSGAWNHSLTREREQISTKIETDTASADESTKLLLADDTVSKERASARKAECRTAARSNSSYNSEDTDMDDQDEQDQDDESADGSENDLFSDFEWLEQIDGRVLQVSMDDSESLQVGSCSGQLIRRGKIQNIFHDEIEEPSTDTSQPGFELFDRYGRLIPEFKIHPVKKGSGIWQEELDEGDLLLIDYLFVKPLYRHRGLGRQMFIEMLDKVRTKTHGQFFAVVKPGYLVRESEEEMGDVSDEAKEAFLIDTIRSATEFWRQLGFRRIGSSEWFGFASDPKHPCHNLGISDDYDPPKPPMRRPGPVFEATQRTISTLCDDECLMHFEQKLADIAIEDSLWRDVDEQGNSFLHIAAINTRPKLVKWIIQQKFGPNILEVRNDAGDTPLEALLSKLEAERTRIGSDNFFKITLCSDRFKGFDPPAVQSIAYLRRIQSLPNTDRLRIKYGCTCGQCIGGFISPRMSLSLQCQAGFNHDSLSDACEAYSGPDFVKINEEDFKYLEEYVCQNLTTNKSMRQGFSELFQHFSTCLEQKMPPIERLVLQIMRDSNEWPPVSRNFLQRGGTVFSVGSIIFEKAMYQDRWAGDGDHWEVFEEQIRKLPSCRNDHEFGFVSSICGYKRVSGISYVNARTGERMDLD